MTINTYPFQSNLPLPAASLNAAIAASQVGIYVEANALAFEAAVRLAAFTGRPVYVAPGTFTVSTEIVITATLGVPFRLILDLQTIIVLDAALQGGVIKIDNCGGQIVEIEGGVFDASAQGGPTGSNSWGILDLTNVGGGRIEGVTFTAAPDYRTVRSDSAIFVTGQDLLIQNCRFTGFADVAVYISGSASQTGTNGIVTAFNSFYGNNVDVIWKRQAVNCIHAGNLHDSSNQGIATGVADVTLQPGKRLIIVNNDFRSVNIPARLEWADGTIFKGNRIRGWGTNLAGTIQPSNPGAIVMLGTHGALLADNIITQSTPEATLYGIIMRDSTINAVQRHSQYNLVHDNVLDGGSAPGCFRMINELAGSDFNHILGNVPLGTWVAELVTTGSNTTTDQESSLMRRSWRFGNVERFAVDGDNIDITPSASGVARVFRPSVPTQYLAVHSAGDGQWIHGMSGAASAKAFRIQSDADGPVTGGGLGCEVWISNTLTFSVETASTAAAARYFSLLSTIPDYADDAAAAAGGIIVGGWYRTGSVQKIRVA